MKSWDRISEVYLVDSFQIRMRPPPGPERAS